ncbi:MAG TPA: hypothetical protein VF476_04420 [Chitinophagaceae bacterium]
MPRNQSISKAIKCLAILSILSIQLMHAQTKPGNPVIDGWYADPEGVILENKYWIFPTYSAKYRQQEERTEEQMNRRTDECRS